MSERRVSRPQGRLLFVALLLVAQTLLAWHAPAHILDGHDGQSAIVAHDCDLCVQGHGLVGVPALFTPPPVLPDTTTPPADVSRPVAVTPTKIHPARAPPRFS
ncbi:hypothetical protein [Alloalcanivorax venustensis]|jgi:hypothetical protein|uniref:hypothetical protein n=1 Tax=Alloalcanivorax venustensis TaxID=172371 RepID=UPI001890FEE7|nr:hypothetical protein [Alloalcanivorax venustensis]|tara:strand:+ start:12167 stop:12475 length:309 start_codon:yes stop_codon:yes gene_type:complete